MLFLSAVLFVCRNRTGIEISTPADIIDYLPSQLPLAVGSLARNVNDLPMLANLRDTLNGSAW